MHVDRCAAVQQMLGPDWLTVGVEQFSTSNEYDWIPERGFNFEKVTVFPDSTSRNWNKLKMAATLFRRIISTGAKDVFICNYDRVEVFLTALLLRFAGRNVYVMGCSKFDDSQRSASREFFKSVFLRPYQGAVSSGHRSRDYLRFLGIPAERIVTEYNTLSISRIQHASGTVPAPEGIGYGRRHFTIVARFVPKKNLRMAIIAFSKYVEASSSPRQLHICGSGPLETELKLLVQELKIDTNVYFRGFLQSNEVARVLGSSVALILPSIEEQFGNVVIEAQAMGVPCLVSDRCGARDVLVRTGVNGFVFEPDNPVGLCLFMKLISEDELLWRRMALECLSSAKRGDSSVFAKAVIKILA